MAWAQAFGVSGKAIFSGTFMNVHAVIWLRRRLQRAVPAQPAELKEKILSELDGLFPRSVVERHLALLSDRYLRTTTPAAQRNISV
jgi:hypothetical protein